MGVSKCQNKKRACLNVCVCLNVIFKKFVCLKCDLGLMELQVVNGIKFT